MIITDTFNICYLCHGIRFQNALNAVPRFNYPQLYAIEIQVNTKIRRGSAILGGQ